MTRPNRYGQQLTHPERLVLRDIANGNTATQIAAHMCRTNATAKAHVKAVLAKLGARNRAHAVRLAYNAGLLTDNDIRPVPAETRP